MLVRNQDVPQKHPEHEHLDGVWGCLNHATLVPRASQTGGSTPAAFQTCSPAIDPNVGMPEQFSCKMALTAPTKNVDVVKKCENPLVGLQSFLRGHKSMMLSNNEEQGHQWTPSPWLIVCTVPESSPTTNQGSPTEEGSTEAPPSTLSNPAIIALERTCSIH